MATYRIELANATTITGIDGSIIDELERRLHDPGERWRPLDVGSAPLKDRIVPAHVTRIVRER